MSRFQPLAPEVEAAIYDVAMTVAYEAIERFIEDGGWEDYPDIGEDDWQRVAEEAMSLASMAMRPDRYQAAYDLLAGRAQGADA